MQSETAIKARLCSLVGPIVLIVFYAQDSQPGANQYGPNPKGASAPSPLLTGRIRPAVFFDQLLPSTKVGKLG